MSLNIIQSAASKVRAPHGKLALSQGSGIEKTPVKVWRDGAAAPPGDETGQARSSEKSGERVPQVFMGRSLRKVLKQEGQPTDWTAPLPGRAQNNTLILDFGCDVSESPVSWLWPGRIPFGRLTFLAGDESRTASLVACDLAARLSRGSPWPDVPPPGNDLASNDPPANDPTGGPLRQGMAKVIYCTPHKERAGRCIPALQRAGAEMTRILCLDGVCKLLPLKADAFPQPYWHRLLLPDDIGALRGAVEDLADVQLLVLDPIEAFLEPQGGNRSIEQAARFLADLAWDFGLAVLAVTRLRPTAARRRSVPAIDNKILAAAAEVAWGIVPSARSEQQHLLFPIQSAVEGQGPALAFNVGAPSQPGTIQWNSQPIEMTAADFADDRNAGFKFAIASAWLKGLLAQGPRLTQEIKQRAQELGISENMLRNVKNDLGVKCGKTGYQGDTMWRLPGGATAKTKSKSSGDSPATVEQNSPADGEDPAEPPNIGGNPTTLKETREISNLDAGGVPPQD